MLKAAVADGIIRTELIPPEGTAFNRFSLGFPVDEDLHFYGCGETHHAFDLKGHKIRIFVAEHQNIKRTDKKMELYGPLEAPEGNLFDFDEYESYYAQPTFTASGKWFLHAKTKGYSEFDFSRPGEVRLNFQEVPVFWVGEVTIFRIGKSPEGGFRFFIASGEALDKPRQFLGTSLSVKTGGKAEEIVNNTVRDGWEPHFAVIYGDCADSLEILGHMLNIETTRY